MATPVIVTEEGRRASDVVNGHLASSPASIGRWVALRLSDGGSDGTLYDTRADAIRHQAHADKIAYVKVPPDGLPPAEASRLLWLHRTFVDAGFRLLDPEDRREPVMPWTTEDLAGLVRSLGKGGGRRWRG